MALGGQSYRLEAAGSVELGQVAVLVQPVLAPLVVLRKCNHTRAECLEISKKHTRSQGSKEARRQGRGDEDVGVP